MTTITLKDRLSANVVYTLASRVGNTRTFVSSGTSLLGQRRLVLQLKENAQTNRVIAKLSIPTTGTDAAGKPVVSWTEVGSFDLSAVLAASTTDAEDFLAQFASLVGHADVKAMYVTGVQV